MTSALKIPWPKLPFIRLLLPTTAGIILQRYWTMDPNTAIAIFLFFAISFAISEFGYFPYRSRWVRGILINASFFFLACVVWSVRSPEQQYSAYVHYLAEQSVLHAEVLETPVEKKNSYKVLVAVEQVTNGSRIQRTQGEAILYFEKCEEVLYLVPGEIVQIRAQISSNNNFINPGQFDYSKYLADKGVLRTAYVRKDEWLRTDQLPTSFLDPFRKLRTELIDILRQGALDGPEGQIATALILGYKEDLDPELKRSFSEAGAMHVLAVSGLHVGIIFMALSFMLSWLENWPYGMIVKVILVILLIWFYALLTGLSPSVLRATIMFTVIGFAGLLNRQANIYNTLAVSAFIMLYFDPKLLFNVGFQLSYSAVIGIVALYPKISPIVASRFWLVNKAWDLTAVSIAAQLATFPLTLLYFHQVPVYSILSNLVIIPAAFGIIALGGVYLLSSWCTMISDVISKVLWWILRITNDSMEFISQLPDPVMIFQHIGPAEALLIYGMMIGMLFFIVHKRHSALKYSLVCFAVFLGLFLWKDIKAGMQNELVFFNQRKGVLFAEVAGRRMTIYGDTTSLTDPYTERTINDATRVYRAQAVDIRTLDLNDNTAALDLRWSEKTISIPTKFNPLERNLIMTPADMVVIPGIFPFWKSTDLEEALETNGQQYHSISKNGVLIIMQ